MWSIEESCKFNDWCKTESISNEVINSLKVALIEFRRQPTNRTKTLFRKGFYEIWDIHVPDPENNSGVSGGFRLVIRLDVETKRIILEIIIRRQNLQWKGSSGKYQKKWDECLAIFKKEERLD
jgi:hypothetical protein